MEIVDNIEFVGKESFSMIIGANLIRVDIPNKSISTYNIVDSKYIDPYSEGRLTEVNSEIASKIEERFEIKISDYGITVHDEKIVMQYNANELDEALTTRWQSIKNFDFRYRSFLGYVVEMHLSLLFMIVVVLITDHIDHELIRRIILMWSTFIMMFSVMRAMDYFFMRSTNTVYFSKSSFKRLQEISKELNIADYKVVDNALDLYSKNIKNLLLK